jgi:hypothetical protein
VVDSDHAVDETGFVQQTIVDLGAIRRVNPDGRVFKVQLA